MQWTRKHEPPANEFDFEGLDEEDKTCIREHVVKKHEEASEDSTWALLEAHSVHGLFQNVDLRELAAAILRHFYVVKASNVPRRGQKDGRRMVGVDYKITETDLSHDADVVAFIKHALDVENTYYSQEKKEYDGPYFCFIQSSGMGKTKVMYEALQVFENRRKTDMNSRPSTHLKKWAYALVIPLQADGVDEDNQVFTVLLDIRKGVTEDNTALEAATEAFAVLDNMLDNLVKNSPKEKKVFFLCFDEAQLYLDAPKFAKEKGSSHKETHRAFYFRCLRYWLRTKQFGRRVVACFTGTNASLSEMRFETDPSIKLSPSRDFIPHVGTRREFYDKGTVFFDVFVQTTTMGCLQTSLKKPNASEYETAICYGRPLFTLMYHGGELSERLKVILSRMLLHPSGSVEPSNEQSMSILGTRVQMGQTTFKIASSLVGSAYANLLYAGQDILHVCFMPDPVCARLAMCMMDEKWICGNINGQSPKYWLNEMKRLFSHGICRPNKGDVGEVMIALYMLLCADRLRKRETNDYTKFSVDLKEWIELMVGGGRPPDSAVELRPSQNTDRLPPGKRKNRISTSEKRFSDQSPPEGRNLRKRGVPMQNVKMTVNFIQVSRNYLRGYGFDWAGVFSQAFLGHLYASANAFYVYDGCPIIDMVAPIRISKHRYAPLLVSMKSHSYFSPSDAETECNRMKQAADAVREKCGAFCLLVVFGSVVKSNDKSLAFSSNMLDALLSNEVVRCVLRIPSNDEFGVTESFSAVAGSAAEKAEVLASHAYIRGYAKCDSSCEELSYEYALRSAPNDDTKNLLNKLATQLKHATVLKAASEETADDMDTD